MNRCAGIAAAWGKGELPGFDHFRREVTAILTPVKWIVSTVCLISYYGAHHSLDSDLLIAFQ